MSDPPVGREDPPFAAGETETLLGFLRYQRETLLRKVAGLDADFPGEPLPEPWASADWAVDPDWELTSATQDDPSWLVERYREAWARTDGIVRAADLDRLSRRAIPTDGVVGAPSLRWIVLHLIEETARHNGHADLIRQALDGATGE